MKTNTSWKRVVIVVALGAALSGVPAYPSVSEAIAADPLLISNPGAVASGSSMPLQPQSSYEVT